MNRRNFLRGLGGVTLGLPFLETFSSETAHAEGGGYAPYAIFVRQANGVSQETNGEPERFWPTQLGALTTSGLEAQSERAVSVLSQYADKLNVLKGVRFPFPGNGCAHSGGANQCLTGAKVSDTPSGGGSLSMGESVDNLIANQLHPEVEPLTLIAAKSNNSGRLSYRGPKQKRAAEDNPFNAYQDLFGLNELPAAALERLRAQRLSVNDLVRTEMQRLMSRKDLSGADRDRLTLHFDAIRDLEVNMSCNFPQGDVAAMEALADTVNDNDNRVDVVHMHMDIIALAVACGAVQAATLQIGFGPDSTQYVVNGQKQYSFHWISHRIQGNGSEGAEIAGADVLHHEIDRLHGNMFKYLLDKLSQYSLGNGTLLDSGCTVWLNDVGNRYHSYRDVPYVCAGSCNDYLKTGQFLDLDDTNVNKLLNTIASAVGCTKTDGSPIDNFGDSSLEGGLIDAMVAG